MQFRSSLIKLALAPALAVAMLAGACADQSVPTGELVAPQHANFARGGVKKFRKLNVTNAAPMSVKVDVDQNGGLLRAGDYFLFVPGGAVKAPTTFTMDVGTDGFVSLTAIETRANGTRVDVGVIGFHKKLTLAMYYGGSAEAVANAQSLQAGWLQSNGSLSPVVSTVNTTYKLVYGQLQHFSGYYIIIPD